MFSIGTLIIFCQWNSISWHVAQILAYVLREIEKPVHYLTWTIRLKYSASIITINPWGELKYEMLLFYVLHVMSIYALKLKSYSLSNEIQGLNAMHSWIPLYAHKISSWSGKWRRRWMAKKNNFLSQKSRQSLSHEARFLTLPHD